jgi:hypothetical protein
VVQELLLDNASAAKLAVNSNPPFPLLAKTLCQKPPATRERAIKVFEVSGAQGLQSLTTQYMAAHVGVASDQDLGLLRTSKFIPVPSQTSPSSVVHARPADVYFASSDSAQTLYQSFFTYVDMGERANNFLRACGVKSEPSIHGEFSSRVLTNAAEVTTLIVKDPQRFLDLAGSPERSVQQEIPPDEQISKPAPASGCQSPISIIFDAYVYEERTFPAGVTAGTQSWVEQTALH